jgi:hypothetical protein
MYTKGFDGRWHEASGAVGIDGKIYVRVDDRDVSTAVLADHELWHRLEALHPQLRGMAEDEAAKTVGEEALRQVIDRYNDHYREGVNVAEGDRQAAYAIVYNRATEELFADAYAGYGLFGADALTAATRQAVARTLARNGTMGGAIDGQGQAQARGAQGAGAATAEQLQRGGGIADGAGAAASAADGRAGGPVGEVVASSSVDAQPDVRAGRHNSHGGEPEGWRLGLDAPVESSQLYESSGVAEGRAARGGAGETRVGVAEPDEQGNHGGTAHEHISADADRKNARRTLAFDLRSQGVVNNKSSDTFLGERGTQAQSLVVLPESEWRKLGDPELESSADRVSRETGQVPIYVVGELWAVGADGSPQLINGAISLRTGQTLICVDSPFWSVSQIVEHELWHFLVLRSPEVVEGAYVAAVEDYGEAEVQKTLEKYEGIYLGFIGKPESERELADFRAFVKEEMFGDAIAMMDSYTAGAPAFQGAVLRAAEMVRTGSVASIEDTKPSTRTSQGIKAKPPPRKSPVTGEAGAPPSARGPNGGGPAPPRDGVGEMGLPTNAVGMRNMGGNAGKPLRNHKTCRKPIDGRHQQGYNSFGGWICE